MRPLALMSQRPAVRALLGALVALALRASRLLGAASVMTGEEILHTQRRVALYDFEAAEAIKDELPPGKGFSCYDTSKLIGTLRDIFQASIVFSKHSAH